jgi:hypothetical protein
VTDDQLKELRAKVVQAERLRSLAETLKKTLKALSSASEVTIRAGSNSITIDKGTCMIGEEAVKTLGEALKRSLEEQVKLAETELAQL